MWRQRHRNNDLFDQIIVDIIVYFPAMQIYIGL